MKNMLVFISVLVLLVSGCASFPGLDFGFNNNQPVTTEYGPDIINIQNTNVIPSPPISTNEKFKVSFEVKNQDDINDVNNVNVVLYDFGLCKPGSMEGFINNATAGTWTYNLGTLSPQQPDFIEMDFTAPKTTEIGGMNAVCPVSYKVDYNFSASTQIDAQVISTTRLEEMQRAGQVASFTPSQSKGRGPIKFDFTYGTNLPVEQDRTLSVFMKVEDKGSGTFGDIPAGQIVLKVPVDFVNSTSGILSYICSEKFYKNATSDGKDGYVTYLNYGKANGTSSTTGQVFKDIPMIKKKSTEIRCEFTAPKVTVDKTYYITANMNYQYSLVGKSEVTVEPIQ